ncbi:MAG: SDR family oxidoreductase [Rhodospirillaceae bacterium]|jgi:NAD(P)-dependent dehydrogenase (short-subunit alcohol dehydrogenase family)|nr:SDR family oxidoreductase [Rhodospirillaceae bacterium]MBT6138725.1 SDR family oxidoreductase [Rhodospirillaceae bacterium]
MEKLLKSDVAIVTGAAQGNGAAIARGLARHGAAVAVADVNLDGARETAAMIEKDGGRAQAFACDVAEREACEALAIATEDAFGPPSILVNNAGILLRGGIDDGDYEERWRRTLDVNVMGAVNMTMACLPALRTTKGRVVNIGSIRSFTADRSAAAYSASKGAILQMTKAFAVELVGDGIRVNAIAPGIIATPMTAITRADPGKISKFLENVPMARVGEADELVGPVVFLASEMSSYVTGTMIPVDGGFLAG